MTKTVTGGLLLALTLVLTTPPAQATCAWVLWSIESTSRVIQAFPTVSECTKALAIRIEASRTKARDAGKTTLMQQHRNDGTTGVSFEVPHIIILWHCLPSDFQLLR